MVINCIIVEDEPLALLRTQSYVGKLPYLNLLASFDNGVDALLFLQEQPVDLVLLDINLGQLSGIELLERARLSMEVILITAHHEYALKGFELQVTDYLLKPYSFDRFLLAVERAKENLSRKPAANVRSFIFIKTEHRLERVLLGDILYIEGMRDYRKIHTLHKKIMTLQTFTELQQELAPDVICRVHKSYMVALGRIESVEKDRIKIGEVMIPISDTYKKSFFERISRFGR